MKNKNKLIIKEFFYLYGWAILGIICLAVIFVFYYYPNNYLNNFTIYKEECKNETLIDTSIKYCSEKHETCNWTEYNGCVPNGGFIGCVEPTKIEDCIKENSTRCVYLPCQEIKKEIKEISYGVCHFKEKITTFCNKVEVDEIEYDFYDNKIAPERYKTFSCPEGYFCKCNMIDELSQGYCYTLCKNDLCNLAFIKISKKDITKEWLDEKCECIESDNCSLAKDYEECIAKNYSCCITGNYKLGGGKCSKYKCGDYEVEVK